MIYKPPKADIDLLRSLNDIEQQLNDLSQPAEASAPETDRDLLDRLDLIESRLNGLSQFERVDQPAAGYKNDGNPSRVLHEDGTWLEPLAGIIKAVPPTAGSDRTRPTNLLNVLGSLAVTGAISGETVRSRNAQVTKRLDFPFVGAMAYKTSTLALGAATVAVVPLDAEYFDTDGFHDNATDNSRLTVPAGLAGYYHVVGRGAFAATTTEGYEALYVEVNADGTSALANMALTSQVVRGGTSNNAVIVEASGVIYLNAGDRVEMFAISESGDDLTYLDRYYDAPSLAMYRVGV